MATENGMDIMEEMATENGMDIMEEMTVGATELTERAVMRAARAMSASVAAGEAIHRAEEGAAIPLLPPWASVLSDRFGEHWAAIVGVVVALVAIPAAVFGGAVWKLVFFFRREEARGLLDRQISGFRAVEHQRDAGPGCGKGNTTSSRRAVKAVGWRDGNESSDGRTTARRESKTQDLPFRQAFRPHDFCTKPTVRSVTHGFEQQRPQRRNITARHCATMTKPDENSPSTTAPDAPNDDAAEIYDVGGDDSTAGDTDAATGACDDTLKTGDGDEDDEEEDLEQLDLEAAPLHLHTLREPARLRGSSTPQTVRSRSRSSSRSRSNSRDVSPSPASKAGSIDGKGHRRTSSRDSDKVPSLVPGSATGEGGTVSSSSSVVDSEIDPDILLDRAGFEEMEPPLPHEVGIGPLASPGMSLQAGHSSGVLPSVNERMSEETLDDCHAFTELKNALHHSLRSLKDGEGGDDGKDLLEPLQECVEEDDVEGSNHNSTDLSPEERKKLIQKQKDIEAKKRQEEEAEKAAKAMAATTIS